MSWIFLHHQVKRMGKTYSAEYGKHSYSHRSGLQTRNSSVYHIQQNICLPPFLPEDKERSILQNVVFFKVLQFLDI
jgi:hypothetical protein